MTPEHKATIDAMTQIEMARMWRFSATGNPLLQGEAGTYFQKVFFEEKGGFTTAISKQLGWEE